MKAFIVSDTHFGVRSNSIEWQDIQSAAFYKWIIPHIKSRYEEGDIIIHAGDVFDSRQSISIKVSYMTEKILTALGSICPVHIILGNHDCHELSDTEINSVRLFNLIPNVNVYDQPVIKTWAGKKVLLMPWRKDPEAEKECLSTFGDADYLFCHTGAQGMKLNKTTVIDHGITLDGVSKYAAVFSGHIHYRQQQKNLTFLGCPYAMTRSDMNNDKGIWELEFETGDVQFFKNPISPIFESYMMDDILEQSIEEIEDKINDNFVDFYLRSSVAKVFPYSEFESLFTKIRKFTYRSSEDLLHDEDLDLIDTDIQTEGFDIVKLAKEYIDNLSIPDETREVVMNKILEMHNAAKKDSKE